MDFIDKTAAIRSGEELENSRIESFVRDSIPDLEGEMQLRQFPSGHSNLTYMLVFKDRELVLRRPPHGTKAKTAHDMGREYRVLNALHPVYPYGPRPLAYTEDTSIMGCPFYVMERIKGIIVRRDFPSGMKLSPEQVSGLFRRMVEVMHELHELDYAKAGLADFGKPAGYVERQVTGWSKRYRNARTPDAPDGERVMQWLQENMPAESAHPGIIHNDFKFDNIVLDPNDPMKIIGVLDWEMATLGDPLMDVGSSLGYWVQSDDPDEAQLMRMMPTHVPGALTREEMVRYYEEISGRHIDHFGFYHCFGLFRLAVIAQQIYYRFYHGQTKDERFKAFITGVQVLERGANRVIDAAGG
jgi:aminoglycoside phosphotransferase (APT) family kinase protein